MVVAAEDIQLPLFAREASVEGFSVDMDSREVLRSVTLRKGGHVTRLPMVDVRTAADDPAGAYYVAWLRSTTAPTLVSPTNGDVRIVDLFSGCGAMTLGVSEAARATGASPVPLLAVDTNDKALAVYRHNFPSARVINASVTDVVDGNLGAAPSRQERDLARTLGPVDLLLGGPPCQGNSDLNNFTRRDDPRNQLYLTMARFAEVAMPRHVLIENVPGVVHDRGNVVGVTTDTLERLGYHVWHQSLKAERLGVPQARRRFFLAASLDGGPPPSFFKQFEVLAPRPLSWAIDDLVDSPDCSDSTYETSAQHYGVNVARIEYLFDQDLYDLPDSERPACHRDKTHSYRSVYGRMRWDEPTPTITTGFGSTGQGRYVHPLRRRTLTPHEAARVQFIPDFFEFPETRRRALQEMIGNAVPPRLSYVMALSLFA